MPSLVYISSTCLQNQAASKKVLKPFSTLPVPWENLRKIFFLAVIRNKSLLLNFFSKELNFSSRSLLHVTVFTLMVEKWMYEAPVNLQKVTGKLIQFKGETRQQIMQIWYDFTCHCSVIFSFCAISASSYQKLKSNMYSYLENKV